MRNALFALLLVCAAAPAAAQLVLPGAVAPTPEGAPSLPAAAKPAKAAPAKAAPAKAKTRRLVGIADAPATTASPVKVVPAASLAGQTLYRNGQGSQISFELRDRSLMVTHLTLSGQGEDGAACRVEVADLPLPVRDEGQPDGMTRIGIPVPACPISFDVLDGAALETGDRQACAFTATRCIIDPSGLWGPPPSTLGPDRDKTVERERTRAEAAVRASFKRLVASTRDRPTIMGYARDQAQFSSTREELCRGYAGEVKHGFCSTRVTEARAAALHVKADLGQAEKAKRKGKGKRQAGHV